MQAEIKYAGVIFEGPCCAHQIAAKVPLHLLPKDGKEDIDHLVKHDGTDVSKLVFHPEIIVIDRDTTNNAFVMIPGTECTLLLKFVC